jgi:hypothetical protein
VHTVRNSVDTARARIDLEREARARRAGGPIEEPAPVALSRANDAGAEEEHAAEVRGVERLHGRHDAGKDIGRGDPGIGEVAR